jgi:hypothetical protein
MREKALMDLKHIHLDKKSIRQYSAILFFETHKRDSRFYKIPPEVAVKIASHTGEHNILYRSFAEKLARDNFM